MRSGVKVSLLLVGADVHDNGLTQPPEKQKVRESRIALGNLEHLPFE